MKFDLSFYAMKKQLILDNKDASLLAEGGMMVIQLVRKD